MQSTSSSTTDAIDNEILPPRTDDPSTTTQSTHPDPGNTQRDPDPIVLSSRKQTRISSRLWTNFGGANSSDYQLTELRATRYCRRRNNSIPSLNSHNLISLGYQLSHSFDYGNDRRWQIDLCLHRFLFAVVHATRRSFLAVFWSLLLLLNSFPVGTTASILLTATTGSSPTETQNQNQQEALSNFSFTETSDLVSAAGYHSETAAVVTTVPGSAGLRTDPTQKTVSEEGTEQGTAEGYLARQNSVDSEDELSFSRSTYYHNYFSSCPPENNNQALEISWPRWLDWYHSVLAISRQRFSRTDADHRTVRRDLDNRSSRASLSLSSPTAAGSTQSSPECLQLSPASIDTLCSRVRYQRVAHMRRHFLFPVDCSSNTKHKQQLSSIGSQNMDLFSLFQLEIQDPNDLEEPETVEKLKQDTVDRCLFSGAQSSDCFSCFNAILNISQLAVRQAEIYYKVLEQAIDCSDADGFSVTSSCQECKGRYRDWMFVLLLLEADLALWKRPICFNAFCEVTELSCPHLRNTQRDDYAGLPSFRCKDPYITQLLSNASTDENCIHPCDFVSNAKQQSQSLKYCNAYRTNSDQRHRQSNKLPSKTSAATKKAKSKQQTKSSKKKTSENQSKLPRGKTKTTAEIRTTSVAASGSDIHSLRSFRTHLAPVWLPPKPFLNLFRIFSLTDLLLLTIQAPLYMLCLCVLRLLIRHLLL